MASPTIGPMRRLLLMVGSIVFVDTMFYAAIVPLLPELSAEFGLSKSGAGILTGAYAAGTLIGAIPAGLIAARIGMRRILLIGIALMSASGLAFALVDDIIALDIARFMQGVGGSATWAGALGWLITVGPAERRGELIGSAFGAAVFGALFGPVLGAIADSIGRDVTFGAVAALGAVLAAWALRADAPPRTAPPTVSSLAAAFRQRRVVAGLWLMLVPGLLYGTVEVLVPLRLDVLGAGAAGIAAVFLFAGLLETGVGPLAGRFSDRRGRIGPIALGLLSAIAVALLLPLPDSVWLLAVVLIVGWPAIGIIWAPAMAMLSDGAEAAALSQVFAASLLNFVWGGGHTLGSTVGAKLGADHGDAVAYGVLALLSALTLAALLLGARPRRGPATGPAD